MSNQSAVPQPLPENLWGKSWRFANLKAGDLVEQIRDRPMPYLCLPEEFSPFFLGLASSLPIGGVIIYGDRNSLVLGGWLNETNPRAIRYVAAQAGVSGGLVLESGNGDRWILATFEDEQVAQAGEIFAQRQAAAEGLHFLLLQPDDSGMTYTGFWLLKNV